MHVYVSEYMPALYLLGYLVVVVVYYPLIYIMRFCNVRIFAE